MVIGEATVVPGLTDAPIQRPGLLPIADFFMDQLSVRITPSVDEFEGCLLDEILKVGVDVHVECAYHVAWRLHS